MATKKTTEKTAGTTRTKTAATAPGKPQDAPNAAIQDNPAGSWEKAQEAHYLGTDALPGEPGEHAAPIAEAAPDPDKKRRGDRKEYFLNNWNGYDSYQCTACQFNTLDRGLFQEHWDATHAERPAPPPDVSYPKFDRFGNFVPPESK